MTIHRRSERLHIVFVLAEREVQVVERRLDYIRQQLHYHQDQLSQLREYNRDYIERVDQQRQRVRAQELISLRRFLQQLSNAEDQHSCTIMDLQQQLNKLQVIWQQKYQRKKSITEMIERIRKEEDVESDKREQREADELALRHYVSHAY